MNSFKLKELNGIFRGRQPDNQTNSSGKFLYLTGKNIKNGELILNADSDKFVNVDEKNNKYILKSGDIIVSSLWKNRKVYSHKKKTPPCFVGNNWIVLRTQKNSYLSNYFKVNEFYEKFEFDCERRLSGLTIPYLTLKELKEIEILKISDEEIQQKIQNQRLLKVERSELLAAINIGRIENEQKYFLIELVEEHFEDPIIKLSKSHESNHLEFKSSFRKDVEKGGSISESKIIHQIIKTIGGFCNSGGGDLLIGVSDNNEIIGIEVDQFDNLDKFLQSLTQQIGNNTNPNVMNLPDVIEITTVEFQNKTICRVNVNPTQKSIYVKYQKEEIFFKRQGPKTISLKGKELGDYLEEKIMLYK